MRRTILTLGLAGILFGNVAYANTYDFNSFTARLTIVPHVLNPQQQRELKCMALNVYHEARGSTHANQVAVAWVTMNRHKSWDMSICDVVYESNYISSRHKMVSQFSWSTGRNRWRHLEMEAWDRSQQVAYDVMFHRVSDPTRGALHFYEKGSHPAWARNAISVRTIGAHNFYKLRESG